MAGDDDQKPPVPPNHAVEEPYYDPYDEYGPFTEEDLINVVSSPNPTLMDLSFSQNPPPPTPTMDISETGVLQELSLSITNGDTNNNNEFLGSPLDDDLISWDMFNDDTLSFDLNEDLNKIDLGEIDSGNNVGETTRLEVSTRVFDENGANFETGGPSTTPVPSSNMSEGILLCSCCTPLRELVHANGGELMRLDIHGGIGFFCHAIFETRRFDGSSNQLRHQTLNLRGLMMEEVQKFMEDYCSEREQGGYTVLQDSNAGFYQAMHAWSIKNQLFMSNWPPRTHLPMSLVMPHPSLNVPPIPLHVGLKEDPPLPNEKKKRKTALAAQRERTGKMTVKDIGMYFHLPIEEAAKRMELCPTVVKKICRKGGLPRWPHRKIKSIEKKITSLRNMLFTTSDARARARIEREVERLQREINEICSQALKNFQ